MLEEAEMAGERIAARLVPTSEIIGDDETDTDLLQKMAAEARRYISSFSWCEAVLDSYFGGGFGGIFGVFFFHIRFSRPEVGPWIWVMVGDVPPAYLPVEDCSSPAEAFRTYMRGMNKWVELAREGKSGTPDQGIPPVHFSPTPEWAEEINRRLYGLTLTVQPLFTDDVEFRVN